MNIRRKSVAGTRGFRVLLIGVGVLAIFCSILVLVPRSNTDRVHVRNNAPVKENQTNDATTKNQTNHQESQAPTSTPPDSATTNVTTSGKSKSTQQSTASTQASAPVQLPTQNQPVTPNPYCPNPAFDMSIVKNSSDYNLNLAVVFPAGEPNLSPSCGGINVSTPVVASLTGSFCSGLLYPTGNNSWGMACSIYGNVPYGSYTFSFTATATNGYSKSTTKTFYYTYNYQQQ